jgi:hypothetical protein
MSGRIFMDNIISKTVHFHGKREFEEAVESREEGTSPNNNTKPKYY